MNQISKRIFAPVNILKDSYVWNFVASILYGFQSVMILVVLTRTVGINDSGIFTIAYANASLFLLLGKFGVRNYQVSDVNKQNTFTDYLIARSITVIIMCITALLFILISANKNEYSNYKTRIIILVCLYKVPDAIEDVYHGECQRRGRLDVGAKCMAIRLAISIISIISIVILFHNLEIALLVSVFFSFVTLIILLGMSRSFLGHNNQFSWRSVKSVLFNCFPLFVGNFLAQYITNAPKYAIDDCLSDSIQACYGFIAMPVFVIGLLNNVIFSPIIFSMAESWKNGQKKYFIKRFCIQLVILLMITVFSVVFAWIMGIPILSFLYNTNLYLYKKELIILLVGGGFLALSGLLNTMITIIRCQYALMLGYLFVSVIAFCVSRNVVCSMGVMGASYLYTILMAALCFIFAIIFVIGFVRNLNEVM